MNLRTLLLLVLISINASAAFAAAPTVEVFSPQGEVKGVRQVSVRFSEQMVAFGAPCLVDPFDVKCPEKGHGLWADGRNWIYDFDRDIPAGVVCEFTLKPDTKALSGQEISGPRAFSFSTGGPAVLETLPYEGAGIDEQQVFIFQLDAEPALKTVLSNVWCSIEDVGERVGIDIIEGQPRGEFIDLFKKQRPYLTDISDSSIIALKCRQTLPNNKNIQIVWAKGVESLSGVPTSQDQRLAFSVRRPFEAHLSCDRENRDAACIPMLPIDLNFTAPVPIEAARKIVLRSYMRAYEPVAPAENARFVHSVRFAGPFPPDMQFLMEVPADLTDDAGRRLSNSNKFPLSLSTDNYPPLAKFAADFGIIERDSPLVPVTVRNIEAEIKAKGLAIPAGAIVGNVSGRMQQIKDNEQIIKWYRALINNKGDEYNTRAKSFLKSEPKAKSFPMPKPNPEQAMQVIGIPLTNPGFHVIELESRLLGKSLLGKNAPMYVSSAALVTNLAAHFKLGRESSLVWVTSLNTGTPVKDAAVTVHQCNGTKIWEGRTDINGIASINITLPPPAECGWPSGYFVFARTHDDMSFVHSQWNQGIESWRFGLPTGSYDGPTIAHTIFDRSLLRAGDTIQMKHVIRRHTMQGFSYISSNDLPKAALLIHSGSSETYQLPLKWDTASGISESSWDIPTGAKLGLYEVILIKDPKPARSEGEDGYWDYYSKGAWQSGSFKVEEFKIPLMKGAIQPPSETLINPTTINLDLSVSYLSGGGAEGLPVKLRTLVEPRGVSFDDYEDFYLANGEVVEGIVKGGRYYDEEGDSQQAAGRKVSTSELVLAGGGALKTAVSDIAKSNKPQSILAEMEYKDPNGLLQTVSRRIPIWPSGIVVGIKPDSWASSKESLKFQVVTLDPTGKPAPGVEVKVDLFKRQWYSHRKRLLGGFYSYEHFNETKKVAPLCQGKTDPSGLLLCEASSDVSGEVIVQAMAHDRQGNASTANASVWIADKSQWWYDVSDSDRMDVLPEKKSYEPGETARLQVRMPFKEATALVTVEREGIIDTYIRKITSTNATIEVPVKGNYSPNVFISVLCIRGRTGEHKPTALVDMSKPAFKLGIAEINVGWQAHELLVDVQADREVYKVRQKAKVKIKVTRADGKPDLAGAEVAIAAVDEGLLELMPNDSWDILEDMMQRRGHELETSTAQMQVVGKRHFGLKALPQGGGGGKQITREMMDTLLKWSGRVKLDANGEAEVEIPLNDSLSSFTIVAVATAKEGLFGTGRTSIRTSQDLMLMSGLPEMVREGDKFKAVFTVRNASEREIAAEVNAQYDDGVGINKLAPIRLALAPGQAHEAAWDVNVPLSATALKWEVSAISAEAEDRLRVSQRVAQVTAPRVVQATIFQLDGSSTITVKRPDDAIPAKGGIRVKLAPKLAYGLISVQEYMQRYPYTCMEQRVSKAIALRDEDMWKGVTNDLPSYLDSEGLVKYFPTCSHGSEVLTSYVLSIAHEAGWEIPSDVKSRMLDGVSGFIDGRVIRYSALPTADLSIRKMGAAEALSRYGMLEPSMLGSIAIEPNLWPTSAVIDWHNVLKRTQGIANREAALNDTQQILRSRLTFRGTTMGFSSETSDALWWLMLSGDVNAVRTVLSFLDNKGWSEDMPRLIRGAIARQHRGHWDLTVANAWGVLALEKFSQKFEPVAPTGTTFVAMDKDRREHNWSAAPNGEAYKFTWPQGEGRLELSHKGAGKPWATVQSIAAIPITKPFENGYKIQKTVTPVLQREPGKWSVGDVVRVKIEVEAQSDMTWVTVSDPVPAGASILGTGLGRDSSILTQQERSTGWAWPVFEERSFEFFRAYYEFAPKGKWSVEYTMRLNNEGRYQLPETRVEALYSPEMSGEIPNAEFTVGH